MAYPRNTLLVAWDHDPPRSNDGVTVHREIGDEVWEWRVPARSLVPQAMAADLLGVTPMARVCGLLCAVNSLEPY